MQGFFRIGMKF